MRRIAFRVWAGALVIVFWVGFFGLLSLVVAWFETVEGVAGPVTGLGYGALVGIIFTIGLLVQLHAPERKIAGVQQAALATPALLIGSVLASDSQNVLPALAGLRTRGWRISAWSAGTATVVFGCASTAFPDHPGAVGRTWGVLAIAGGVLFIAVAELEHRRSKQL